uniref:Exonuclease domain-containing protein n=1 Tax=Magallana gigas TaxID=29159 RepID=K1Q752_MAGGI
MPQTENARLVTGIVANSSGVSVAGKSVKSDNIHSAADKFIRYLTKFKNVCLIAHNGRRFDFPVLVSTFKNTQKDTQLSIVVTGCVDSLAMFKKCFKNQDSYKQESLYRSLFNETYGAHNAVDDVKALGKLVQHALLSQIDTLSFTFPLKAVIQQLIYNGEKARNYNSFATLVQNAVLSKCMAGKIAGSGLTLGHLKAIKNRDGEDGLRNTFLVKTEGQSRPGTNQRGLAWGESSRHTAHYLGAGLAPDRHGGSVQVLNSNNGDVNTEDNDMGQHSTLQLSKDRQEEDNSETK